MSNWQKWAERPFYDPESERLLCVLYRSRNKDNAGIEGFAERRRSFLMGFGPEANPAQVLSHSFSSFAAAGLPGEMSRLYVSVNARDNAKVRKGLLERLIFDDSASMGTIPSLLCGIAAKHECAAERRWLFDFDPPHGHDDENQVTVFVKDAARCGDLPLESIEIHTTPNGYAIIVPHGFDTRGLLEKWDAIVTLKRDDLLCVSWLRNDD